MNSAQKGAEVLLSVLVFAHQGAPFASAGYAGEGILVYVHLYAFGIDGDGPKAHCCVAIFCFRPGSANARDRAVERGKGEISFSAQPNSVRELLEHYPRMARNIKAKLFAKRE